MPPRVVQVVFTRALAGDPEAALEAWPTLTETAGAARRAGIEVEVVISGGRDAAIEQGGVTYRFVPSRSALLRAAARWEPSIVHVNGLCFPLETWRLRRRLPGVPLLVQDHGSAPIGGWRAAVYRACLRGIDAVVFTARDQAADFRPILPAGVRVFEAIEGSSRFEPGDRAAARETTGLEGDPCLLWVGRLLAVKDPLTALEAFRLALEELPGARLWCCYAGGDLERGVRARIAADARLQGSVRLLGRVEHARLELYYRAADFLLGASRKEGSGYAVIEALACGLPPLVSDIPSLRRITGDGCFGALAPPGDAQAMARHIVAWAREDRAALRQAARRHFERVLSWDAIGREWSGVYSALAGQP